MIKGVKILEEVPVYDGFWMPLCYIVAGLCFIATALITAYCYKNKWWFFESSQRTTRNKIANAMTIMLMYWIVILAGMVVTLITDMVLTGIKFEGVKGDTVQYKIQVTNECSFIEFHNTFEIIEEYENNIYLIEYKNN